MSKMTIAKFSKEYKPFLDACRKAGVEPSQNEASKYRRGLGRAIKHSSEKWRILPHKVNN